ncbi:MAG TPA: hypothetical protein VH120_06155 [Gemmataceae bacterium]|nr:hypothetical protein [Gemmataceae bacterium]
MRRTLVSLLLSTAAFAGSARGADDLTPLVPALPMPAPVPGFAVPSGPVSFYMPNRLDVWQHYGVDRQGRWVPRVILIGEGAFYYSNGRPYGLLPVNQQYVMPYLLD